MQEEPVPEVVMGYDRTRVLDDLMLGERTLDVAGKHGLSPGRVSQLRRELHDDWEQAQRPCAVRVIARAHVAPLATIVYPLILGPFPLANVLERYTDPRRSGRGGSGVDRPQRAEQAQEERSRCRLVVLLIMVQPAITGFAANRSSSLGSRATTGCGWPTDELLPGPWGIPARLPVLDRRLGVTQTLIQAQTVVRLRPVTRSNRHVAPFWSWVLFAA
jgi:hypothetical protein